MGSGDNHSLPLADASSRFGFREAGTGAGEIAPPWLLRRSSSLSFGAAGCLDRVIDFLFPSHDLTLRRELRQGSVPL